MILFYLVEKFLSQASVYNQIREAIGIDNVFAKIVIREYLFKHENVEITCRRNGPAVTITVEKENKCCCCIENGEELFHCDFTFALYCPKFPKCVQGTNNSDIFHKIFLTQFLNSTCDTVRFK